MILLLNRKYFLVNLKSFPSKWIIFHRKRENIGFKRNTNFFLSIYSNRFYVAAHFRISIGKVDLQNKMLYSISYITYILFLRFDTHVLSLTGKRV